MDRGAATTFPDPSDREPTGFIDDWKDTRTYQNAKALKAKANSLTGASYHNTQKKIIKKRRRRSSQQNKENIQGKLQDFPLLINTIQYK